MKDYSEFCSAIRLRESGNSYRCVNTLGYLGAYQFGLARLCDLGITRRKDPASHSMANEDFEFIPPQTELGFLADHALQDSCFERHVILLRHSLEKYLAGADPSGAVAICHLLGLGGFILYWHKHIDAKDGFGTPASAYYERFSGYDLPQFDSVGGVSTLEEEKRIAMPKQDVTVSIESSGYALGQHVAKLVSARKSGVAGELAALVAELPGLVEAIPQVGPDVAEDKMAFLKGVNLAAYDIAAAI